MYEIHQPRVRPAACLLDRAGTSVTQDCLLDAVRHLSPNELEELAEDLEFHARTGLIGLHMSRLISRIEDTLDRAAA